jgi:Tat protein translocase TatB subunit
VGITELLVVLVVALIVIPPDKLPEVMRTAGKILRELRLASNTVVRELTEAVDDPLGLRRPPDAVAKPPVVAPPSEPVPVSKPPGPES